jgi:hypothetical protein
MTVDLTKLPPFLKGLTLRQVQFLKDQHRFIVNASGRRSRKTLLSRRKILIHALKYANQRMFQGAPTRPQAHDIYWEALKSDTAYFWSKEPSKGNMTVYLKNGSTIQCVGLINAKRMEGRPWHGGMITECADIDPTVWVENLRPVLSDTNGFCLFDGVPEGRNWWYNLNVYASGGGTLPITRPIVGAYAENPDDPEWAYYHWFSSDVLNAREIESARALLDERTFQQEYEGAFVSYGGQLYYCYQPECVNDVIAHRNPSQKLYMTCDFNKNPMVWLLAQTDRASGRKRIKFVDTVTQMHNAKTHAGAVQFIRQFSDQRDKHVIIYGDASNNYESHRDWTTDYRLIQNTLRKHGWTVQLKIPANNPNINNRVTVANSLMEHERLYINSRCKMLMLDLERNESDNTGGKDKTDPMQTHASDAFDYLVWPLFAPEFKDIGVARS